MIVIYELIFFLMYEISTSFFKQIISFSINQTKACLTYFVFKEPSCIPSHQKFDCDVSIVNACFSFLFNFLPV